MHVIITVMQRFDLWWQLRFKPPYFSPTCYSRLSSLLLLKQSWPGNHDSSKFSIACMEHQVLFASHTCTECTEAAPQQTQLLFFCFFACPFSISLLFVPSGHPSLPPSLLFQCSTEGRLTQRFQPGVYECAQESAHRQDYNQLKEAAEDNNGLKDRNDKGWKNE